MVQIMTKLVMIIGDTHINSTVGLCPNTVRLADGGTYTPSSGQTWLNGRWGQLWSDFMVLDNKNDFTEKILVLNGDIVDRNVHSLHQLITPNESTVIKQAYEILKPRVDLFDTVYFNKGTEAHVKQSGELEEMLAQMLGCKQNKSGEYTNWHLDLNVDGVTMDIEHHGRIGGKEWTKLTPLLSLGVEKMLDSIRRGYEYPKLIVRNHMHTFGDTVNNLPTRVIQNAAFQLATAFTHRIGIVRPADIGGIIVLCDNGKYEVKDYVWNPEFQGYIEH